jgi:hypothetical protein
MIRHFVWTQLLALTLVVAVLLLGPIGASYAQTSGGAQYGGNLGQTAHAGTGANGGATVPFTGLDLGGVAGTGIVLIAAGIVLRRRTTQLG